MIELTPSAQIRLNDYFQELRRVLSGSPSVDPTDVERDVRDHIDAALVGQAAPVEAPALDDVLHKLGSPAQWLPDAGLRPRTISLSESLRQIGRRLARGPESYRMAYLSFLVLVAGCSLSFLAQVGGPLVIAIPVSFVLSRAALSLFTPQRLTGGQKWLLYPSLVAVYVPLVVILVTPVIYLARTALDVVPFLLLGFMWLFAGLVSAIFPRAVRSIFYPFADWFTRRFGIGVATIGLIELLLVVTFLYTHGLSSGPPDVRRAKMTKTAVQPDVQVKGVPLRDDRFRD